MRTSRILLFCLLGELENWVEDIRREYGLSLLAYPGVMLDVGELVEDERARFSPQWKRLFLLKKPKEWKAVPDRSDIRPKPWGWIDVTVGGLTHNNSAKIILMTDIGASTDEGIEKATWKACSKLQRKIAKECHKGVIGRNVKFDGESTYKNIFYSAGAKSEFEQGALLKHRCGDNSVFAPLLEK